MEDFSSSDTIKWIFLFLLCVACIILALCFQKSSTSVLAPVAGVPFGVPTPTSFPPLTFDSVFRQDHTWVNHLGQDHVRVLVATGDVIPARSVNFQTVKYNDFTWGWKYIAPLLEAGDVTLINLESPLVPNCPVTNSGMIFCGDQRHIQGLVFAGVDVANFANNHMGNWGAEGISETKQLLNDSGIKASGLGEPTVVEVKGMKFVFLGFDDIGPTVVPIAGSDEEEMKKEIEEAKTIGDIVVVSMNWGVEYTDGPTERQQYLAHAAIDFGADLIIGNHPHWIEPVEIYKGKVIMYAYGNTIFDQMWSEETKEGVIGKYTFCDKDLVDIEFIPTYIKDYGQPEILEGVKKLSILDRLEKISLNASL